MEDMKKIGCREVGWKWYGGIVQLVGYVQEVISMQSRGQLKFYHWGRLEVYYYFVVN